MELLIFGGILFIGWAFDTIFDFGDDPDPASGNVEDDPAAADANGGTSEDTPGNYDTGDLLSDSEDGDSKSQALEISESDGPVPIVSNKFDNTIAQIADDSAETGEYSEAINVDATTPGGDITAEVFGFDPENDVVELEHPLAHDNPTVTVTDFSDGGGAFIALDGIVVAEVNGAQGLKPANVLLAMT